MVTKIRMLTAAVVLATVAMQSTHSKQQIPERPPGTTELDYLWTCDKVDRDALYDDDTFCYWHPESSVFSNIPVSPAVRPTGNNRAFILVESMEYEVGSTGLVIKVPAGFVTDYASIPPRLWSLYSPHDQYSRAAVVHDYLYWSQLCTRLQADNLFMIAMKESDVPALTRTAVYEVVRAVADGPWGDNGLEREKHMPKVVPLDRKDFPPNWTWEKYREYLVSSGVKDPIFTGDDYCDLGNSTEVPTSARRKRVLTEPTLVERRAK